MPRIVEQLPDGTVVTLSRDGVAVCASVMSRDREKIERVVTLLSREFQASFFQPVCVSGEWATFGRITSRQ